MKTYLLVSTCALLGSILISCSSGEQSNRGEKDLSKIVNPFIGTGGHGHTYPGPSTPFGGVQLSPDTRLTGWDGCGGYHYSDSVIYGFSHTHLSGTGVSDYGDILFMPFTGKLNFKNGYKTSPDSGYGSRFSHSNEEAEAGYYKVLLSDYNVEVELTATERCGFHKYTFKGEDQPSFILDLKHRDELLDYSIELIDNKFLQGKRISNAWARAQHVYFYAEVKDGVKEILYNADSTKLMFKTNSTGEILLKTGISAVSIEGAKKNLEQEIGHWDFSKTKKETQKKWNQELSKIEVQMLTSAEEEIFYTSLYHSFLNPNVFQDVDGQYRGTDLKIHTANDFTNYTVFSLWDTYRATHPLFTLTQRKRTKDFINTFLNQYKNGGKLPVWELAGNYTGCMIGYHSIPVIVDAYQKGITDFDTDLALKAMIETSKASELGKEAYAEFGYMASDQEHESTSKNLEYAYDDWCIAQFAKALGKDSIYKEYNIRAQSYKNIFDPKTTFMRSKRNQQFQEPFDPTEVNFNFTEANSWQYSFYVPQDVTGLINLHNGPEAFEKKLDDLFTAPDQTSGRTQVDITGLIGQYAHGNEPSHHMAYLYSYVKKPHKTQEKIRQILDEMYSNKPDGLIGNEDCGQMSSWYVLSALGFYPVTPGSKDYVFGSPNIQSATLNLENGKQLKIKTKNQSATNIYIQAIELNGEAYAKSYISHDDIMNGGTLTFQMGSTPNLDWNHTGPQTSILDAQITPVPYVSSKDQIFSDSLLVELNCAEKEAVIYYTLDGSEANESSMRYEKPISLKESSTLNAFSLSDSKLKSKSIQSKFFKIDNRRKVTYTSPYDPQYSAGGDKGLIDYIKGGDDFRTGAWQGWQGMNVEFVVDLDEPQNISKLGVNCIQDIRSWIFMPTKVEFLVSKDGKSYSKVGEVIPAVPDDQYDNIVKEFSIEIKQSKIRYIKVLAQTYGTLPEWHLGAGGEAYIFMDEVIIE